MADTNTSPGPGAIGSAPKAGPFLYTFTARLPFVLGFADSLDYTITVAGHYPSDREVEMYGGPPFVRLRIFNVDVADRKFAAANLTTAVKHFDDSDIPTGDVDGKHLYEQWVTLETPACLLSDEDPGDGAYALHRSLRTLNAFLQAFAIARQKDWVRPISARELRPVVAIGRINSGGDWSYQGPMLMHPDAKSSLLGSHPVEQHVEELNLALELVIGEAPFMRSRQWRARAERRKYEGDATDAIISFQVAAEAMLFELWGLLLLEEGTSPQEVTKRRENQHFKPLLSGQLAQRLGGTWDLTLAGQPVGRYWRDLYKLRNRIAHDGYQPHDGDAEKAENAYAALEGFVDERLRAKGKRYPATLSAKLGLGREVLLARLDAEGDAWAAGMLGHLLWDRGDSKRAEAAFRRSQERGDVSASVSLGKLLIEKRDLAGAEAAWRQADLRGSAEGAANLGTLLNTERADHSGAEAAWGRADERGSPEGAFNLGLAYAERGASASAEAAWRRADDRGSADAAVSLGNVLHSRADDEGAEAAWRRADERGSAGGAYGVGLAAQRRGDAETAETAFRRADERGSDQGAMSLGRMLEERGDAEAAEKLYARAADRGSLEGVFNLGVILHKQKRLDEAAGAYQRAAAGGFGKAMFNLGVLSSERGDVGQALAYFRQAIEGNDPGIAERAREALAELEA